MVPQYLLNDGIIVCCVLLVISLISAIVLVTKRGEQDEFNQDPLVSREPNHNISSQKLKYESESFHWTVNKPDAD